MNFKKRIALKVSPQCLRPQLPLPLLCLCLVCLHAPTSWAVKGEEPIRLGFVETGWPPYVIRNEDGKADGIMCDVFLEIGRKLNYEVSFEMYPSKRLDELARTGFVDVRPKAKEWVEDPNAYEWSDPVLDSSDYIIYRKDSPQPFETLNSLMGQHVAVFSGFIYPKLEDLFISGTIQREDAFSNIAMLRMVYSGRVAATIMNKNVAQWEMRQHPELRYALVFSKKPLDRAKYRFCFYRNHDWSAFIKAFNKELNQLKDDGRLTQILLKYQ